MTPTTISAPSQVAHPTPSRSRTGAPTRSRRGAPTRGESNALAPRSGVVSARRRLDPLGRYTDATGRAREVIAGRRGDGGVLVVDRDALTLCDRRLVAHLAADEPAGNAALVCTHYLRDAHRGRCRRVTAEDLTGRPSTEDEESKRLAGDSSHGTELVGRCGDGEHCVYRLERMWTDAAAGELRWRRHPRHDGPVAPRTVCLREVIGALESYEPVCGLTLRALAVYGEDPEVSTAVLRSEYERMRESPIVLNRKLRQAVFATVERHGLSMSEIAHRCGRVKRDSKGHASGETSWLARRVGILPESGASRRTPWVHSDVLALIARNGLGISPREVELG
jgi:hypothetical protein